MKQLVVVGSMLALVATLSSGCTSGPASTGTVVGQYRFVGGPPPGVNRLAPGTIWAHEGHASRSQMMTMHPAAHVNTDTTGHFTLTLTAGEYTLLGALGLSRSVKTDGCGVRMTVRVRASTRTRVNLVCSVP